MRQLDQSPEWCAERMRCADCMLLAMLSASTVSGSSIVGRHHRQAAAVEQAAAAIGAMPTYVFNSTAECRTKIVM